MLENMFPFYLITDDIGNIIDAAKKAAAEANRTTSDIMDQLNDIKAEVNNISISPTVSNMDNVLNDVEMTGKCCTFNGLYCCNVFLQFSTASTFVLSHFLCNFHLTVKNVSSSIPSLLDKIEELNSQIGSGNNVSENINRIKELIEQAREAANRVRLCIFI